jgi:hypothetical protein
MDGLYIWRKFQELIEPDLFFLVEILALAGQEPA